MKLEIVRLDGSVDEVRRLLEDRPELLNGGVILPDTPAEVRPAFINEILAGVPGAVREASERFLDEVLSWDSVDAQQGTSRVNDTGTRPYIRLYHRPARYGAFAYVMPRRGRIHFRLPADAADAFNSARRLNRGTGDRYHVEVPLAVEAVGDGIALARLAYDAADPGR
ncbi:MAG: hypothetical protein M3323_01075 [Actinomycetota bacterium]|nr:hypothetical protein [Actinomycetota bacterium]